MQKTLSVRCGAGCAAAQSYVFAKPMPVQRAVRGAFAQEGGQAHAPGCPAPGLRLRQRLQCKAGRIPCAGGRPDDRAGCIPGASPPPTASAACSARG